MENNYSSSRRVIELTVLSGEDLRIDRRLIKKNAFTIVQADASDRHHTTKVDESGGSFPTWNEIFVLELPMHVRFIHLQVQCKAASSSSSSSSGNNNNNNNKTVGSAEIPVSDFIGGYVPQNHLHFLSYRLRDAKGQKNGIINVSVRVKVSPEHAATTTNNSSNPARLTLQGYPPACSSQGYASFSSPRVGGIVTGVPVWCANRA